MEKRYLAMGMWLCEGKLKMKIAHFRLPSSSQKLACLSSLINSVRDLQFPSAGLYFHAHLLYHNASSTAHRARMSWKQSRPQSLRGSEDEIELKMVAILQYTLLCCQRSRLRVNLYSSPDFSRSRFNMAASSRSRSKTPTKTSNLMRY